MDANTYFTVQEERLDAEWDRKMEEAEAQRPELVASKFGELSDVDVLELIAGMADYTQFAQQLQRLVREGKSNDKYAVGAMFDASCQILKLLLAECDRQYGADLVEQAAHGTGEGKL